MALHVDDGSMFGDETSPKYQKALKESSANFTIKKQSTLNEKSEDYLGMQWQQFAGKDPQIVISMDTYIDKLILADVPTKAEDTTFDGCSTP